jgi:hypothetical protein
MIKESLEKPKSHDYDYDNNNKGTFGAGICQTPRTFVYLHTDHYYYISLKFDGQTIKIE